MLNVILNTPTIFAEMTKPTIEVHLGGVAGVGEAATLLSEAVIAGETLVAGRVVIMSGGKAFYFQPANPAHAGRAYGITRQSATVDQPVVVVTAGTLQHDSFSFAADTRLFVGADGVITAAVPSEGISQLAGASAASNKIRINFSHITKKV